MSTPAISFRDVRLAFGAQQVLAGASLEIPRGEATFVIGASGAGKSVLARLAVGLLTPDSGQIQLEGIPVAPLAPHALAALRRRCTLVLQGAALLDWLSLEENVALPLRAALPHAQALDKARERLAEVGLLDHARQLPTTLGPGVRKRASIARALALEPSIVIYDEPTTGLDPRAARQIDELICAGTKGGRTSLIVSHDPTSVRAAADHVALLEEGRIALVAPRAAFEASDHASVRAFFAP